VRWCCPAARSPALWRFASVGGCPAARLLRLGQSNRGVAAGVALGSMMVDCP